MTAVGHWIVTAPWHMLQIGELNVDYFTRRNPDRTTKRQRGSSKRSDMA